MKFHEAMRKYRTDNRITLRSWWQTTGVDTCRISELERQVTFHQPTKKERELFTKAGFECMDLQYEIDIEKIVKEAQFYKDMIEMDKTEWRFKYMAFPFCTHYDGEPINGPVDPEE